MSGSLQRLTKNDEVMTRTLRISGEAKTVAIISVTAAGPGAGASAADTIIDGTADSTRGRLYNGTGLGLSVNPTGDRVNPAGTGDAIATQDAFTIVLEDYDKLRDGGTFTFRGYALTEEVNWVELEFTIQLAIGNQAPEFAEGTEAAVATLSLSEDKIPGYEIYDFDATDPDHTTGVTFSVSGDTKDVNDNFVFRIGTTDGKLTVGPKPLDYQGDEEAQRRRRRS